MTKIATLYIIKFFVIIIATIAQLPMPTKALEAKVGALRLPLKWLAHYLKGSGRAMQVPREIVEQAKSAIMHSVVQAHTSYQAPVCAGTNLDHIPRNKYCLYSSTIYEGRGFYNRPTLFYLVGGFTFLLRRDWLVSGKDRYDWHPNGFSADGEPQYFTSPLGGPKLMKVLEFITGKHGWFTPAGFPMKEAGISNRLWDDMHLVGARPFWSYFDQYDILSDEDIVKILVAIDWDEDNRRPEKVYRTTAKQLHETFFGKPVESSWLHEDLTAIGIMVNNVPTDIINHSIGKDTFVVEGYDYYESKYFASLVLLSNTNREEFLEFFTVWFEDDDEN